MYDCDYGGFAYPWPTVPEAGKPFKKSPSNPQQVIF